MIIKGRVKAFSFVFIARIAEKEKWRNKRKIAVCVVPCYLLPVHTSFR